MRTQQRVLAFLAFVGQARRFFVYLQKMHRVIQVFGLYLSASMTLLSATACSGGAVQSVPLAMATPYTSGSTGSIGIRITVSPHPVMTATFRKRRPSFISAATAGVSIAITGSGTYNAVLNISPGAVACGGSNASPRTCTGTIAVAPGSYTVVATSYDAAPVANAIPSGSHEIAQGTVSGVTITAGAANVTTLYLGGLITGFGAVAYASVPADGLAHNVGFALAPTDYGNEAIIAGTNDPYNNPITLTLTETGGSGHEYFLKNAVNVGSSATITKSSDSVQVHYDGGGSAGYTGSVAITATGVSTQTVNISPLYVVPTGGHQYGTAIHFNALHQTAVVTATEASAPGTVTYTAVLTGCAGIATAGTVSGSGAAAAVTITSGATASASGCSIKFTDSAGYNLTSTISNSTFVPTAVANSTLWLDANDSSTLTTSGGLVSQWNDKSGQGNNVTQSTTSSKPSVSANAINGLTAISFDGANSTMKNTSLNGQGGTTAYSFFAIANVTSVSNSPAFLSSGVVSNEPDFHATNLSEFTFNYGDSVGNGSRSPTTFSAGATHLGDAYFTNAGAEGAYTDGIGNTGTKTYSSNPFTSLFVGSKADTNHYVAGLIGEEILFNRAVTTAERQKLEGYLAWKWGIAANLPGAHPYLTTPP